VARGIRVGKERVRRMMQVHLNPETPKKQNQPTQLAA
jgi:hypothetical protein